MFNTLKKKWYNFLKLNKVFKTFLFLLLLNISLSINIFSWVVAQQTLPWMKLVSSQNWNWTIWDTWHQKNIWNTSSDHHQKLKEQQWDDWDELLNQEENNDNKIDNSKTTLQKIKEHENTTPKSKTQIINNLVNKDGQELEKTENEIDRLQREVEKLNLQSQSFQTIENNFKKEIANLEEKLNNQWKIGELKQNNNFLRKELEEKINIVEQLQKEQIQTQIQKAELELLIEKYQKLYDDYSWKIVKKRNEKLKEIFIMVGYLILWIILLRVVQSLINKAFNWTKKEIIDTLFGVIMSVITTYTILHSIVLLLQAFTTFFYIIMFMLWSIIVSFRQYILSAIAFISRMAFRIRIGSFAKIDNHVCRIKKIDIIFVQVDILSEDLSYQWTKTYFNYDFMTKASTLDIKELWVLNTLKYQVLLHQSSSHLIHIMDWLLESKKIDMNEENQLNAELSHDWMVHIIWTKNEDRFLLDYHYNMNKEKGKDNKEHLELTLILKSIKWKEAQVFDLIKEINTLITIPESWNESWEKK